MGHFVAVQEFHGGEQEVISPDVLDTVQHVLTRAKAKVLRLARVVLGFGHSAVVEISAGPAGTVASPEVVEHVSMEGASFAARHMKVPDTNIWSFRNENRSDAAVECILRAFAPKLVGPVVAKLLTLHHRFCPLPRPP